MRKYTWEEFYEKFYDWSESTQVRNLSALTSLGDADEVAEIIQELDYFDESAAIRLLKRAVEEKLAFSGEDCSDFYDMGDFDTADAALLNSASRLTAKDLENLTGYADDDLIIRICKQRKFSIPISLEEYTNDFTEEPQPPAKLGFFGAILAGLGISHAVDKLSRPPQHNGTCNGDCANCPPHYGYRYGRWYYGHSHVYGCEFGGNKGDGGL